MPHHRIEMIVLTLGSQTQINVITQRQHAIPQTHDAANAGQTIQLCPINIISDDDGRATAGQAMLHRAGAKGREQRLIHRAGTQNSQKRDHEFGRSRQHHRHCIPRLHAQFDQQVGKAR